MDPTASSLFDARHPSMWNAGKVPSRVTERAYTRIIKTIEGCWISTYSVASHGYAQVGWRSGEKTSMVLAHRAAWEHVNGPVPVGKSLDHLCRNRPCVNPDHLRLMDNYENARRTGGKNWRLGECANGHPDSFLAHDPYRRTKRGERRAGKRCSKCKRLYMDRANWRNRRPGEPYPDRLLLRIETTTREIPDAA